MRIDRPASAAAEAFELNHGLHGLHGLDAARQASAAGSLMVREIRVIRAIRGSFIGGCAALTLVGAAHSQARTNEVISEPVAIAPGFDAHMIVVNVPPAGDGPLTTVGQRGHRHPASTYAYVSKGAVISRLGDGAEKRYETGQGWSETPNQPHYLVNASRTEPAQLVVVQIAHAGVTTLTEPLTAPAVPPTPVPPIEHPVKR